MASQIDSSQRTNGMSQRSSFVSLAEEITAMNKNTVEITTKMNDIVTSRDSAVSITLVDTGGNKSEYYMPTIGFLKKEIDKINTNIKRLSGIESTSNIIDGKSIRKVFTTDINKEPYPINDIGSVSTFEPINNHFFESLMNPLLAIELDISDKVTTNINKILSRRYIVKFERNVDFTLTSDGLKSYNSFQDRFLNQTNIDINEFVNWYDIQINIGLVQDIVEPYDEQYFDLSVNESNAHGLFSVIKTETDTINKKLWYHLNTLNYYTKDGFDKSLTIGDNLILNRLNSSTRWQVKEINTESSNFRVTLERLEGYDPIPIGTNMLSYYSDLTHSKRVKITVGFDEYNIIFIKPVNTENNVISTIWSKGTSFYTNDLILNIDDNTDLSEFYVKNVYDYGKLLKDLAKKTIPVEYSEIPNTVILNSQDFKVVQINKHMTDTQDSKVLNNLHSQSLFAKAKLTEINNAISEKTKEMNTRSFSTTSDRNAIQNELKKLIDQQNTETKSLSTTVSQISTKKIDTSVNSKFRIRGFWNVPQPVNNGKSDPQHIIQFRVQYRYSSKTGEVNPTEGFIVKETINSEISDSLGRVISIAPSKSKSIPTSKSKSRQLLDLIEKRNLENLSINPNSIITPILTGNINSSIDSGNSRKNKTGYFSNWVEFLTDARKRYWDADSETWYWKVENIEDADTPNINQLDIPIQTNEKVEIRIKSISEVGWPSTLVESEWSGVLTIEFPNSLSNVLNDNEVIIKQADQDETFVSIDDTLNSRGVYRHSQDSFYVNETYYAHNDKGLISSFKDNNGNYVNVYEYLNILTTKIKNLEDQISNAKGEFVAILHTPTEDIKINTNKTYNLVVELEDYAEKTGTTRTYFNSIGIIDDYYVEIQNTSNNPLGLLANRKYESTYANTFYKYESDRTLLVNYNSDLYTQNDYQYIWFSDNSEGIGINSGVSFGQTPDVLSSPGYNLGFSGETYTTVPPLTGNTLYGNIINDVEWQGTTLSDPHPLFCTVHPRIYNITDIIEGSTEKMKSLPGNTNDNVIIHIYYKLDGSQTDDSVYTIPVGETPDVSYRSVKFFIEPETLTRPFEFELRFTLKQFRDVYVSDYSPTKSDFSDLSDLSDFAKRL